MAFRQSGGADLRPAAPRPPERKRASGRSLFAQALRSSAKSGEPRPSPFPSPKASGPDRRAPPGPSDRAVALAPSGPRFGSPWAQNGATLQTMASELSPGFLVASPSLLDPNFARSVVLLVDHRSEGSLGFVVNRPAEIPFSSVVEELGLPRPDAGPPSIPVMVGGPVSPHTGWLVMGDGDTMEEPGTIRVNEGIHISASREKLEDLARNASARRHLLVLGYAGWGAGQLDEEIKQGAWIPVDLDETVIFDTPFDGRWQAALQCAGLDPRMVVGAPSAPNSGGPGAN